MIDILCTWSVLYACAVHLRCSPPSRLYPMRPLQLRSLLPLQVRSLRPLQLRSLRPLQLRSLRPLQLQSLRHATCERCTSKRIGSHALHSRRLCSSPLKISIPRSSLEAPSWYRRYSAYLSKDRIYRPCRASKEPRLDRWVSGKHDEKE